MAESSRAGPSAAGRSAAGEVTPVGPAGAIRRRPTPLWLRATGYWAYQYKRTWRSSITTSFLYPVLYLAAMGVGLGSLIDKHAHLVGGVPYLDFVAPGLLAVTAMQIGANESTYPVMGAIKWFRTYFAMLATPLRVVDVLRGHLAWIAVRLLTVSAIYLVVLAAFGVVASPLAVLALPAAVLAGPGICRPHRRLRRHPGQRRRVHHHLPAGVDPAVPVLRHLLPGNRASRVAAGGGLRHPAVPRGGPVPGIGAGHRRPRSPGRRGLPGGPGRPRLRGRVGGLPSAAGRMSARRDLGTTAGMGQGPHRSEETAIKGGYGGAPGRGVSSAWPLRITPAAALGRGRARRIVERNVVAYRRGWVFLLSGFFEPFFYLLSIGVGLNRLVGTVPVDGRTLSYAAFVAPGLLASSAMNGALFDATFNVFFNVKIQ